MLVFEEMDSYGHDMIVFARDEKVGLKTIIAVHDGVFRPAGGGPRFLDYKPEDDALYDVLRLSKGMSLKTRARPSSWAAAKQSLSAIPRQ